MDQCTWHLATLRKSGFLQDDARIVRIEDVTHGQLVLAQTVNDWDNDLRIFLIAPDGQILDRLGIEFHTCADTLKNFRAIGDSAFGFSFLGEWEIHILPEPQTLTFPQHPLGPIFWGGEMSGSGGLAGKGTKENAFLLLRSASEREDSTIRSSRSRAKRATG